MSFNSLAFIFFFLLVSTLYFALPHRWRWIWLLGSGYYFYVTWKPVFLLFLVAPTVLTYLLALQMGKVSLFSKRKSYLLLCVLFNLSLLFIFKYSYFFYHSFRDVLGLSSHAPSFTLLLPVGISFYIFKCISYGMDVYRGTLKPEKHFGRFALYVSFFPQLLAGPIERATNLLPQFYQRFQFDYQRVTGGIKRMLWGLFQKMVIADNVAKLVDSVYSQPTQYEGVTLMIATVFYAFQIYCDFSGYSHIAIGAAQVLGFKTMENFNHPYFAKSIPDFWRRWHISLSTWFRDYLYIPMGGKRVSMPRWCFNLLMVMFICGLWHGANWTFVVWGGLHGCYLVLSVATQQVREKVCDVIGLKRVPRFHQGLRMGMTFCLVCLAWIFFRANSITDALTILRHIFTGWGNLSGILGRFPFWMEMRFEFLIGLISIGVLVGVEILERKGPLFFLLNSKPLWVRWSVYYTLLLSILLFGEFGFVQFIYFQF